MKLSIKNVMVTAVIILAASALYLYTQAAKMPAPSWHMINVNSGKLQGDANLLIVGDETVMIDAGYASEARIAVIPYLKKLGIKKIDHFFITHPHRDHYEGLAVILGAGIPIKNLYYKVPASDIKDCCYNKTDFLKFIRYAEERGAKLIQPQTGFKLSLPEGSTLELLHAQEGNLPDVKFDVNDMSMIMKWYVNGSTVLFPGDLNMKLGSILSGDKRMRSDFLKMPHHGAESLAPNAFFDTVKPSAVLVPGPDWVWCSERGARPGKWTITRKVPTWVNGINGNIKVEFNRDGAMITPERTDGRCKLRAFGVMLIKNENRLTLN
ncbi:MAG: MBL fold metallo-hydrolase [Gammaproteobacteria bacterium]|nr:MBL fold metallo-hydrolase [Gammaproteobacteria bacterium]